VTIISLIQSVLRPGKIKWCFIIIAVLVPTLNFIEVTHSLQSETSKYFAVLFCLVCISTASQLDSSFTVKGICILRHVIELRNVLLLGFLSVNEQIIIRKDTESTETEKGPGVA
jgi:hypothetical protein